MKKQRHILPNFPTFADVSNKMSKIFEFVLFSELTHKELKSYQVLTHYYFSSNIVWGVCQSETTIFQKTCS